jgi:putative ribosome biogenesis GTPase RsgA
LLERESASASLHEYAGQARRGDGRLVLVAGEAGVGKSALVERLRLDLPDATRSSRSRRVADRGHRVPWDRTRRP